jgi:hypothetical protein
MIQGLHEMFENQARSMSHPVLRPNRMLIVCVPRNQVYTHTVQKMGTESPMSQYNIFIT